MWTFDGVRIFVQKYNGSNKQIIARLQPLSGDTINQIYGYEGNVEKISCIVVGDTDMNALRAKARTGNSYELVSYEGTIGDFFVSDIQKDRIMCICQTLRQDLDSDAPVYNVEMTLFEDS
jgi:hypothetical protein